ncbi:MAG: hypothetical protein ABSE98_07730 [Acidimicrobiales bacterium]
MTRSAVCRAVISAGRRRLLIATLGALVAAVLAIDQAKRLIALARRQGMSRDELAQLITGLG